MNYNMKLIRKFSNETLFSFCFILYIIGTMIEMLIRAVLAVSICVLWYIFTGNYPNILKDKEEFITFKIIEYILDKYTYNEFE